MIVNEQKDLEFINKCNCIVDYIELEKAILWYAEKPVTQIKKIYMHGRYPAVSIHRKKVHVHRLLMMYWENRILETNEHVHHKDEDKLNAIKNNLEIVLASNHLSNHNKGRKFCSAHRLKISEANRNRIGMKYSQKVTIPLNELKDFISKGYSIRKIAELYNCDWSTIKSRINEHPELLERDEE